MKYLDRRRLYRFDKPYQPDKNGDLLVRGGIVHYLAIRRAK